VEALTDTVGLWVIGLGPGVFDVINRQVELVIMDFRFTAVFGASIGQNCKILQVRMS
jgi:hypothetical protein